MTSECRRPLMKSASDLNTCNKESYGHRRRLTDALCHKCSSAYVFRSTNWGYHFVLVMPQKELWSGLFCCARGFLCWMQKQRSNKKRKKIHSHWGVTGSQMVMRWPSKRNKITCIDVIVSRFRLVLWSPNLSVQFGDAYGDFHLCCHRLTWLPLWNSISNFPGPLSNSGL